MMDCGTLNYQRNTNNQKEKHMTTDKFSALDDLMFDVTGESAGRALSLIRQDMNPHALAQEMITALSEGRGNIETADAETYDEYLEAIEEVLDTVDAALTAPERMRITHDRWAELEEDPDSRRLRTGYDPGYYASIRKQPMWIVSGSNEAAQEAAKSFSDTWKRVTKDDTDLRIICEYGTFSLSQTDDYQRAMLRVRPYVRKINGIEQPMLSVGGVQINLRTGYVECMVSGCKHTGQLTNLDNDREWMEYQVLRILYHLGNHKGGKYGNLFPKFTAPPEPLRDNAAMKLASRARAKFPSAFAPA